MIITRTPFRLSLFGGGTDYPSWFQERGGLVVAMAMERYCYISVRRLPPFFGHKTRAVYSKIEAVKRHEDIQHPSIKHCLQHLGITDGLEIHHDGDLPARSGIGSSSSFTVGLLNALHGLCFEMVTKRDLADEAIMVEQQLIGEDVGIQDQIMAAYGGMQIIDMGMGDQYEVRPLILPPEYIKSLEEHVLLGFTGISRVANDYAKVQVSNIENGTSISEMGEIKDIAEHGLGLFVKNANLEEIGKLLGESWQIKRKLAIGVSNDKIDDLYRSAIRVGAFGGKLLGAGGGGFIMLLAPPYKHKAIKEALPGIKVWVPFGIDKLGSQIIFHQATDNN